jgi:predicted PurR-regulated permease PerM
VLAIEGALSAAGLLLLGVPYALALGAFVSVTAIIPYLGPWIGAIPAVLVALTVSPTTALLTALLFLVIQQLEGNFLTPQIQGDTLRVHLSWSSSR